MGFEERAVVVFYDPPEKGQPYIVTVVLPEKREMISIDLSALPYERLQELYAKPYDLHDLIVNALKERGVLRDESDNEQSGSVDVDVEL